MAPGLCKSSQQKPQMHVPVSDGCQGCRASCFAVLSPAALVIRCSESNNWSTTILYNTAFAPSRAPLCTPSRVSVDGLSFTSLEPTRSDVIQRSSLSQYCVKHVQGCLINGPLLQPVVDSMADFLTIFEELPDSYDGRVDRDWLDGGVPDHPKFEKAVEIQNIVMGIKDLLIAKILEGCEKLVGPVFIYSLWENQLLWEALISGHTYGVVYLYSRFDALKAYLHAIAFAIRDGNCDNKRK